MSLASCAATQYDIFDAMPAVRLTDIVDALEMQFDESSSFLDLDTGQVKTVSRDLLLEAEESGDDNEEPDLPEWQQQEWEIAQRIISTDRFRKLPTKFDVHEWAIMEEFSLEVESDEVREAPSTALGHSGCSRTPFGGTASKQPGLHSAPKPFGRSRSNGAKNTTSFGCS